MTADASPAVALRSLTPRELEVMQMPPIRWLVENLIPAGALVLLVGRPKQGKSLLAIDLLASVALGQTFLNCATAQGGAVYIPAEDALPLVRDRLFNRLGSERDVPLYVAPVDGSLDQSLYLDKQESFDRLAALLEEREPALAVLDPMREMHRGKENDADEMALLLRPLRHLAHDTGCTVLLIHHRNKASTDPGTATRGSSAISGSADVVITLDTQNDDDESLTPGQTVKLTVEGRYGPRVKLSARLGSGIRWTVVGPTVDADATVPGRILRVLRESLVPLSAIQIAGATGARLHAVQNAVTELVRAGSVERLGSGTKREPFTYTVSAVVPPDASPIPPRQEEPSRPSPAGWSDDGSSPAEGIGEPLRRNHPVDGNGYLDGPPTCQDCDRPATHINSDGLVRCRDHALLGLGGLTNPLVAGGG